MTQQRKYINYYKRPESHCAIACVRLISSNQRPLWHSMRSCVSASSWVMVIIHGAVAPLTRRTRRRSVVYNVWNTLQGPSDVIRSQWRSQTRILGQDFRSVWQKLESMLWGFHSIFLFGFVFAETKNKQNETGSDSDRFRFFILTQVIQQEKLQGGTSQTEQTKTERRSGESTKTKTEIKVESVRQN